MTVRLLGTLSLLLAGVVTFGCGPAANKQADIDRKAAERKAAEEKEAAAKVAEDQAAAEKAAAEKAAADKAASVDKWSRALQSKDADEREKAASALGKLGPEAKGAVPALIEALGDPNFAVRSSAAVALDEIRSEQEPLYKRAGRLLRKKEIEPGDIPVLVAAANDYSLQAKAIRRDVIAALGRAKASLAVSTLNDAVIAFDNDVRRAAIEALGSLGTEGVPALIMVLERRGILDYPEDRMSALYYLSRIRPVKDKTVKALGDALSDPYLYVPMKSAQALGDIGQEAKPAIPQLVEALKETPKGLRTRTMAIEVTGKDGKPTTKRVFLRELALAALLKIDQQHAVEHLVTGLGHSDASVRKGAAWALAELGPKAKVAVPELQKRLNDADPGVREEATAALKKIKE